MGDLEQLQTERRNFEAQFGSLASLGFEDKVGTAVSSDDEEFRGFSDEDNDSLSDTSEVKVGPKVIKLNDTPFTAPVSRKDQQRLRAGRAPTLQEVEKRTPKPSVGQDDDDNVENDIKLQRLLQESHILQAHTKYSGAEVTLQTLNYEEPSGKARKKALTSRLRNLSSVNSSGHPKKLEKMPMAMRNGMIKSRQKQINKYEEEARNAGIVLSRVKKGETRDLGVGNGVTFASDRLGRGRKKITRVRDRGLRIHSVGKMTRHGLKISKQEIDRVQR